MVYEMWKESFELILYTTDLGKPFDSISYGKSGFQNYSRAKQLDEFTNHRITMLSMRRVYPNKSEHYSDFAMNKHLANRFIHKCVVSLKKGVCLPLAWIRSLSLSLTPSIYISLFSTYLSPYSKCIHRRMHTMISDTLSKRALRSQLGGVEQW